MKDVTIGINFHWERKELQRFKGTLKLIIEEEKLTAINIISIEDYLTSVISSEMSATASLELLKAHAVISRSWLLNKIEEREGENEKPRTENQELRINKPENEELRIRNNEKPQMKTDNAAHSSFFILHLSSGTTTKHTLILMFVLMIIANVIKELRVLLLPKLSKQFFLREGKCLCSRITFVMLGFLNVAAVL